ncbi:MAG: RHS repeat-associated core domain-containing protein [Candidatus Acidiferrales bacterium]
MNYKMRLLASAIFVLALTSPLFAQNPYPYDPVLDAGMHDLQSYQGADIDSVNLATGNLSLHIPLISYPQRGGKFHLDYFIGYSSGALVQFHAPDNGPWDWQSPYVGSVGYYAPPTFNTIAIVTKNFPFVEYIHTVTGTNTFIQQDFVEEGDGSVHPMGWLNSSQLRSLDGSGFYVNYPTSSNAVILDRDGITTSSSGGITTATDSNGNQMTLSATTITDTMGRKIPTSATSGTWSVPGIAGIDGGKANFVFSGTSTDQVITLPNLTSYSFQFTTRTLPLLYRQTTAQTYPVLTKVTLPTGGSISYTYASTPTQSPCATETNYYFPVLSRSVDANDGTGPKTWTYSYNLSTGITTVTDPLGDKSVHTFGLNPCLAPYETQVEESNNSGSPLKTVNTTYSYISNADIYEYFDVVPISVTTIWPNGQQQQMSYTYDSSNGFSFTFGLLVDQVGPYFDPTPSGYTNNPWSVSATDYGNGSPGSVLRKTNTTYMAFAGPNASSYFANNLLSLPYTVQTLNVSGYKCSEVDYAYDVSTRLFSSGVSEQHVAAPNAFRGNISSVTNQLSSTPCQSGGTWTAVTSNRNVYDTGVPYQNIDPLNHTTTFSYLSTYFGAYPTTVANPLSQSTVYAYDFDSGLVTSVKDPNSQTTSYSYDVMWRLAQANFPDGGQTAITRQETSYPFSATSTQTASPSPSIVKTNFFDGLGRVSESQFNSAPAPACMSGTVPTTTTTFDALGRKASVSNPYCSTSDQTYGITQYSYDALNRTMVITNPDSTTIQNTYTGAATETQDEGNGALRVSRISQVDGLGRTVTVCEVSSATQLGSGKTPAACGQAIAATGFLTTYTYDALDNLLSVSQGGYLRRSFTYDSFSRLTRASNPESGVISYVYDSDGNVTSRTAPEANQTSASTTDITTSTYDVLNRLTAKSYSQSLNTVSFAYDATTVSNGIGRMTSATAETPKIVFVTLPDVATGDVYIVMDVSSEIFSYDAMGRVINNSQCTPNNCPSGFLPVNYTYDLAGHTTSMTNGVGVTLSEVYDGAGRVTSLASSLEGTQYPSPLVSNMTYNAPGEEVSASLGNSLNETAAYDKRTRVTSFAAGSVYSCSMTYEPDSDIATANDSVNSNWTYTYDSFNRLSTSSSAAQSYSYVYDRFGNRWQQNVTGGTGLQSTLSFMGVGLLGPTNKADTYSYDAAGNLLNDSVNSYLYDDENRIVQVSGSSGLTIYIYDAMGRRVEKSSATETVDFVNDLAGNKITELNPPGVMQRGEVFAAGRHIATYWNSTTYFDHADWLGSERARSTYQGALAETCASLPFGDGLTCSNSDPSPLHFTGKERDSESGLDNFIARYDSSSLGRFMTPDEIGPGQHPENPQSWNLYSYVMNNPLTLTDPTGQYVCAKSVSASQCDNFQKTLDAAQKAANNLTSKAAKDAQRAIDAYGKQGVDNGVTIAQGKVGADTAETAVAGAAGAKTANNPNGQNITVTFDKASNMLNGQNVDAVAALTAHEGVHVADQSDWVSSGFADSAHPSNLQTDHDAYTVELNIFYGLGNSNATISFGPRDYRFSLPLQSGSGGKVDSMIKREDPRWNLDAWQKNTSGAH